MSKAKFNTLIHAENRLQVCAMLMLTVEVEFQVLREALAISDSVLSKHLKSLEEADYVHLIRRKHNSRPRTWAALTANGRQAYQEHLAALQAIVGEL